MSFNRSHYSELLNKFEVSFQDTSFVHNEVNYYPVIKIQYAYQLHLLLTKGFPKSIGKPAITLPKIGILKRLKLKWKLLQSKIPKNLDEHISPVLLVGFKEHNTDKLLSGNGQLQNPFITPFEQILNNGGVKSDQLYVDALAGHQCLGETFKNYGATKALIAEDLFSNKELVNAIRAVEKFSNNNDVVLSGLADHLFKAVLDNEFNYQFFKSYLTIASHKKVLCYCYYNNQVMALTRAARDLGIMVTEYQHSLQSDEHFAYGAWEYNLRNAEHHFPDIFWLWRRSDVLRTKRNFASLQKRSKALQGGNTYLSLLSSIFNLQQPKTTKGILVALQGIWVPAFIEEAVAQDTEHTWYFRLHPRYPSDKEHLERLKLKYPDRVETEQANGLNLYELFGKVKFCITAFSGTVLEAQAFGIQNIIFSDDGYKAYRSYIEDEAFMYITNIRELLDILNDTERAFKPHDDMLIDTAQVADNVLKTFTI